MFIFGVLLDMALAGLLSWLLDMNFVIMFLLIAEMIRRVNVINAIKYRDEMAFLLNQTGGMPNKDA
jgi:hypothetical protein